MKRIILITTFAALSLGAVAGTGLDLTSRVELRAARAAMKGRTLRKGAPLRADSRAQRQTDRIGAFIRLNDGFSADDLREIGVEVLTVRGDIALCLVPIDNAEDIALDRAVRVMQIARRTNAHMDLGKSAIGLDAIHAGTQGLDRPYTGKGIVAGVVDQGIDPNHLNFLNPDGSSRLGYFYTIDYANNVNGYSHKGYFGDEVKKFTTDTPYTYHGTHTLGILSGLYTGNVTMPDASKFVDKNTPVPTVSAQNPYTGAAPGATLAAAGCGTLNDMFIAMGVDQLCQFSYDRKQPAVISLSLGSNVGPHDKSSIMNQFLELTATKAEDNPMPPVLCVSAGNEGDRRICLRKRLHAGESFRTLIWPSVYQYDPDVENSVTAYQDNVAIYSQDSTRLTVVARLYNVDRGYRVAASMPALSEGVGAYYISDSSFQVTSSDQIDSNLAKYFYGYVGLGGLMDEDVNRYYAMVDYALQDNDANRTSRSDALTSSKYVLGFEVSIAEGQTVPEDGIMVECYASGQTSEMYDYKQTSFETGSRNGSINDMAIADKLIVVGSYNTRKEWMCLDGLPASYIADGDYFTEGRVSGFSSFGTLSDGRNLPHFCGPGAAIVSSVNRYFTELSDIKDQAAALYQAVATDSSNRLNYWKQEVGTSMSTPLVAGAIACWMEADPTLEYDEIREIAMETAVVDDDVRAGDPVQWGAGKFDAMAGLKEVIRRRDAGVQDVIADADSRLVLTPAGDDVYNVFVGGVSELNVTVYSLQGSPVTTVSAPADEVTVDLSALAPGVYILSANNLTRKITVR